MPTVLSIDTSAPQLSVAVARDGTLLASTLAPQRQASARLLALITEVLDGGSLSLRDLDGLVALRGPGSFTGIRIGLATVQGIHQSTGLPVTGWSSLEVIARSAPREEPRILSLVHALREEWYSQLFSNETGEVVPLETPRRRQANELTDLGPLYAVQTASQRAASLVIETEVVSSLASVAAVTASLSAPEWDASPLAHPLYLAPPPASLPKQPKSVLPRGS